MIVLICMARPSIFQGQMAVKVNAAGRFLP